jgi:protein-S-isoprenylcysteine O-methyltransferase Ste14
MHYFIRWAQRKTSLWQQLPILGLGAILFLFLIPFFLVRVLHQLDSTMGVDHLFPTPIFFFIGAVLAILGGIAALWAISVQATLAAGTPFPMFPTKKLIATGPFALCRNPMTLGTIFAYYGVSLMIGSITSLIAITLLALLLFAYIKNIEEKELALRFGEEYLEYKAATPFIIPNIFRKENKNSR